MGAEKASKFCNGSSVKETNDIILNLAKTSKNSDKGAIGFKKSTYPRSKMPIELKHKFDLISENFNYNDEFVFSIDLSNPSNIKVNKQVNEKVIEAGINYPELLIEDVLLYQMRK